MIKPEDVHSLTDFQRNAKAHINRLKKTRRPELLTVNGRGVVVVLDAATYQRLSERLADAAEEAAIAEAVRDLKAGKYKPMSEFAREFRDKRSRPRRRKIA